MLSKALTTAAAGSAGGDYTISKSLRFNSADSAYLSRTPASAGNRKTWTWSGWVKRGKSGDFMTLFSAAADTSNLTIIRFKDDNKIEVRNAISAATQFQLVTTQVFRDFASFYHVVLAVDTDNGTAGDRVRLYVNGVEVTAFDTDTQPSSGNLTFVNNTQAHNIGRDSGNPSNYYFDGYLADIHFVDGQQLTPSSFGEVDSVTGVWKPIRYAGTYGTNGFHLDFSDNSNTTATTLGKDSSGNGNNWTPSGSPGFSVTAGAGNDSLVDSPTQYGTDTGAGGEVRGNYCTLNPLDSGGVTTSNGNLEGSFPTISNYRTIKATLGISSGKWYWEMVSPSLSGGDPRGLWGIADSSASLTNFVGSNVNSWGFYNVEDASNAAIYNNGSKVTNYGSVWGANDVIGVAFDADNGKIWFSINGTYPNSGNPATGTNPGASSIPTGIYFPAISMINSVTATVICNFGQRPFAYTAPSGFKALCTTNLPDPTVVQGDDHFNTAIYTANASTQSITGVGFKPDFVWTKSRANAYQHMAYDVIRGVNKYLLPNNTDAEATNGGSGGVTSFDADGFSLGSGDNSNFTSGSAAVAWCWKGGGTGVSNTDGTITSTVSANTTAGISIITCSPTGSAFTVGHGLGSAPKMIISKLYQSVAGWNCYHASLGADKYLVLESTSAALTSSTLWQNTAPTSSVISFAAVSAPMLFYAFAEVEGFSKFGSYTGNGSADGPFVYTGFRPAFVMVKSSSAGGNWLMQNNKTLGYNPSNSELYANLTNAETTADRADLLSNGFKPRINSAENNSSGVTYIYMAFASNPFKYALAR